MPSFPLVGWHALYAVAFDKCFDAATQREDIIDYDARLVRRSPRMLQYHMLLCAPPSYHLEKDTYSARARPPSSATYRGPFRRRRAVTIKAETEQDAHTSARRFDSQDADGRALFKRVVRRRQTPQDSHFGRCLASMPLCGYRQRDGRASRCSYRRQRVAHLNLMPSGYFDATLRRDVLPMPQQL